MKININIGSKILAARLADNATARDFVSVLPFDCISCLRAAFVVLCLGLPLASAALTGCSLVALY